mgnify:CR=1 FL=1|jgi:hypothetical protein
MFRDSGWDAGRRSGDARRGAQEAPVEDGEASALAADEPQVQAPAADAAADGAAGGKGEGGGEGGRAWTKAHPKQVRAGA